MHTIRINDKFHGFDAGLESIGSGIGVGSGLTPYKLIVETIEGAV